MLRTIAELLVTNLVEMVMLSVGLKAQPARVLAEIRRPALLVRELLLVAFGVPLLTLLVVKLLPVPPWTAVVAILFGISPAAPFLLTSYHRGESTVNKALAVVAVALAASVFIVPLWLASLNRFFGFSLRASPIGIFGMLALKVFAPLLAGMLIRWRAPRVAGVMVWVLTVALVIASVIIVVLLLYLARGTLPLVTAPMVLGLLLLMTGSAVLGEIAGGRDLELREILGRVAMSGNPAIALAVIGTSYPELDLAGLIAAYLVCRGIATIPYTLLARHRYARRRRTQPSAEQAEQPT